MAEPPEIRIGTAEREEAMKRLSDNFAAGRLSVAEFDERSGIVAAAMTRGDLAPVFSDLPALVSDTPALVKREPRFGALVPERIMPVVPVLAIILFVITHQWWVFLLIPLAGALLFGESNRERRGRRRDRRRER